MSTIPVKFTLSERDRRPPIELPRTEELLSPSAADETIEDEGLIGEDNPPMRVARLAPRPRKA